MCIYTDITPYLTRQLKDEMSLPFESTCICNTGFPLLNLFGGNQGKDICSAES